MDNRYGVEGMHGIGGGGVVSAESERNLRIAEDLCRRGRPQDSLPYLQEAMKDKNNYDAEIQFAYLSPDLLFSIEVMESAEKRGRALLKSRLGANCFDDNGPCVGKFHDIVLTRPYMRVLQTHVRFCFETKQYAKAAGTIMEMMRLCPLDNLRQRFWLAPFLIRLGRPADALSLCLAWLDAAKNDTILVRGGTTFPAPSADLLPPDIEESYSEYSACDLAYNAALAAFKLWGADSPKAAQLLRIAVRTQRDILLKIVMRRPQPKEGSLASRTFNGPEEANEYLWVAQDLWTEPDVWAWINRDPALTGVLKECSRPECVTKETEPGEFKRCSACWQVAYCASACQKEDWKRHKKDCTVHTQSKKAMKNLVKNKATKMPVVILKDGILHTA
ncbi:hypothetical protein FB45DRAFT_1063294 [Roridomyces roridus]|uniref:MYND-type domain-containing protein n=1 Tax=Roridomyces roridus TaxID=1738132 RepID=A0AAD7BF17_9AGAR|nr:hypothetical protein FB45DRAFT_1063294 [Roridomyces roridus]